jgi:MFS family permease
MEDEDTLGRKTPKQARISVAIFFFISGFTFSTWASRIPTIQQQLQLNEAQLGSTLFAMPIGLMITMPLTGFLLTRFSSKSIMVIGALVSIINLSLIGLITNVWQLVALLFLFGSSRNFLSISINAQSVGVQALYKKSIITSFHGVWSLAGFAGAAGGLLAVWANISIGWHFFVVSILLILLTLYFYPSALDQKPSHKERKAGFALPDKSVLKFGLIAFACMACEGTMYDWSGIYFQKAVQAPKEIVTLGFALYIGAMTLARFVGDRLVTRFGILTMIKYSGVLICGGLLLAVLFPTVLIAGLGFILVGFGVSCVVPLVFTLASRSSALGAGSAITAVSTVSYFGFLIVPPVIGYVAEAANLRWSFSLMALLGAMVTFLVMQLKEE